MRDFLKHGSLVFAGTMAANILFYASYALVQRALGVENAGLFMALLATTQLLAVPGTVLATVIAKVSADATAQGRQGVLRSLARSMARMCIPLLIIAVVGATAGNGVLRSYFHTRDSWDIAMAALAFALFFPLTPQRAVLQGGGLFGSFVTSTVIEALLKAGTGVAVYILGGGVSGAFAGFAVATAAAYLYNVLVGMRTAPALERLQLAAHTVKHHALGVALPVAGLTVITYADAILVRHYLPAYSAGLYAAVALVGRAVVTVMSFLPTVVLPKATTAFAEGRSPLPLLGLAGAAGTAVLVPLLLIIGLFPAQIAGGIAGGQFRPAAPLLLPYAAAMSGLALATILATYLISINRRGFAIPATIVCGLEVFAIVFIHPNVRTVVDIVLGGHLSVLCVTLAATFASFRASHQPVEPDAIAAAEIMTQSAGT